jgi:hypothetical protein
VSPTDTFFGCKGRTEYIFLIGRSIDFQATKGHRGGLKAGELPGQTNISDKGYNVQVSEEKLESISRFEKVPADEECLIRDMAEILQEKCPGINAKAKSGVTRTQKI